MKKATIFLILVAYILLLELMAAQEKPTRLIKPNGGDILYKDRTIDIKWESSRLKGTVKILLIKNKQVLRTIHTFKADRTLNQMGSFRWKIPKNIDISSDYKIRIEGSDGESKVTYESESFFAITEYNSLGRKAETENISYKMGVDVNANEVTNIQTNNKGQIIGYEYCKEGKCYKVENITYDDKGKVTGYTLIDMDTRKKTVYSNMKYDDEGNLISFTKKNP